MLNTVMLMSDLEIRDIRTAKRVSAARHANVEGMTISRAGIVCLAAILMTAMWAPIIYFGSMLFGAAMELSVLLPDFGRNLLHLAVRPGSGCERGREFRPGGFGSAKRDVALNDVF